MELRLYNSVTRQKETFTPIEASNVRLYVCGPTVYDRAHIGNARPLIVFDVLFRLLRHRYGPAHVTYVRNITDVDDKINARAAERGITIRALTEATTAGFHADVAGLGCLPPTVEPRATEHIAAMIAVIARLIERGHAYREDGHVLFDTPSMPEYGSLSRRPLDEMIAGARIEVAGYKRAETDFVLWKPAAADEPGWDSPWGRGRPGWHIECSAMSWQHLGEVFDIHGGGIDLLFPHHENELAQSRCAFGHDTMAQVWMHNGFLQVEGEKMSKSTGNFVTINALLETGTFGGRSWSGEVLRLAMLRKHYRAPIDWTVDALEEAERTLDRWYAVADKAGAPVAAEPDAAALAALLDDLNTPASIGALHRGFVENPGAAIAAARLLGLLTEDPGQWIARRRGGAPIDATAVQALVDQRLAARAARNWAESDRLRDALAAMGISLKDSKEGTAWSVRPPGSQA